MTLRFAPLPVDLPPGCHGVRLDVADVAPLVAMMPAGDWPEAMRDAADSRRADFLAGRLAAREAVRLLTGSDARIGRSEDGSPRWPDGVAGSISHYDGVACAVAVDGSATGGIGVDIAPLLDGDRLRAVVRRCLTDAERAAAPSDADVSLAFAAKEAVFKAAHARVQRHIGFDEAEIAVLDSGAGTWTASLGHMLAVDLDTTSLTGTYAWDRSLVYAVVALPAASIGS